MKNYLMFQLLSATYTSLCSSLLSSLFFSLNTSHSPSSASISSLRSPRTTLPHTPLVISTPHNISSIHFTLVSLHLSIHISPTPARLLPLFSRSNFLRFSLMSACLLPLAFVFFANYTPSSFTQFSLQPFFRRSFFFHLSSVSSQWDWGRDGRAVRSSVPSFVCSLCHSMCLSSSLLLAGNEQQQQHKSTSKKNIVEKWY